MFSKNNYANVFENAGLYTFLEITKAQTAPIRSMVQSMQDWINSPFHPISHFPISRTANASFELFDRMTKTYPKPDFNIHKTKVDGVEHYVEEEVVLERTFCRLINFRKLPNVTKLPKLLIVAPMSGHYATLLRGTVEGCLPYFDVYITDWANVRDIPISKGEFSFDDFIDYCIKFMTKLAPNLSVMAVCQPAVPVAAAVAIMSAENPNSSILPSNMILIGGPIDTRISPTKVNNYAADKEIQWFENNVITRVPMNYPGFLREVYPGFLQLSGFMSMNMKRHVGEHIKLFQHLVIGDDDSKEIHTKFYDEYLAVMDLPAEFFLETIKQVFQEHSLPEGKMISRGRAVKLEAIKNTALLVLEGELDDITGHEQTKAAIDLCTGIPISKKEYHLQKGVGHYGLFNDSKFCKKIVPLIKEFTYRYLDSK
jgi:poly(3-hydroxybutyrate) depolymerase